MSFNSSGIRGYSTTMRIDNTSRIGYFFLFRGDFVDKILIRRTKLPLNLMEIFDKTDYSGLMDRETSRTPGVIVLNCAILKSQVWGSSKCIYERIQEVQTPRDFYLPLGGHARGNGGIWFPKHL